MSLLEKQQQLIADYSIIGDSQERLAAIVDELVAHETLEGDEVHEIVRQWLG